MAKVTVVGSAVVVTSSLTLEDIAMVQKYRPEALRIVDEESKEPIFVIGLANSGAGSISKYGASFGGETHDDAKLATITLMGFDLSGDIKETLADAFGSAMVNLRSLEEQIPNVLDAIRAERTAIMETITVA